MVLSAVCHGSVEGVQTGFSATRDPTLARTYLCISRGTRLALWTLAGELLRCDLRAGWKT